MLLVRGGVIHLNQTSLDTLRTFVEHSQRFRWPGVILLAWTARRIFASLFSALELVFGAPPRSFAKHHLVALGMVLVTGVALLVTMASTMLLASGEGLLLRLKSSGELEGLNVFLARVLPMAVTFSFFFLVYRFVPRRVTRASYAALGALLATVLWESAKGAFAYYMRNVAQYAGIYGTLEGIIVLALWLELSVSIVLYCGEIVALLMSRQAARSEDEEPEPAPQETSPPVVETAPSDAEPPAPPSAGEGSPSDLQPERK